MDPLAALLRRYVRGYTGAHDFAVCREVIAGDYRLFMGEHEVRGRDDGYIPATAHAFEQFPTLDLTVHELLIGDGRAAMRFTEHGHCRRYGADCAWGGVSLYRWDGERLTECRVEQDYLGRRRQQRGAAPDPIEPPMLDPWSVVGEPAADGVEDTVRTWLLRGGLAEAPAGSLDDEFCAGPARVCLHEPVAEVLDLFGAGRRVAFHALTTGTYAGGLPGFENAVGAPGSLYCSGIATVADDGAVQVRAVTDRLGAERRLASALSGAS